MKCIVDATCKIPICVARVQLDEHCTHQPWHLRLPLLWWPNIHNTLIVPVPIADPTPVQGNSLDLHDLLQLRRSVGAVVLPSVVAPMAIASRCTLGSRRLALVATVQASGARIARVQTRQPPLHSIAEYQSRRMPQSWITASKVAGRVRRWMALVDDGDGHPVSILILLVHNPRHIILPLCPIKDVHDHACLAERACGLPPPPLIVECVNGT